MQSEDQPAAPDPLWGNKWRRCFDEGLAQLGEKDRQAILLRFFESKSLAEVGVRLCAGEDSARMRISRALEKLRRYFMKRGVASTVTSWAEPLPPIRSSRAQGRWQNPRPRLRWQKGRRSAVQH